MSVKDDLSFRVTSEIIKNSKTLTCECGGMIFYRGMVVKRLSPLVSPSGKEEFIPIDIMACSKCGKIPAELNEDNILPIELISKTKK